MKRHYMNPFGCGHLSFLLLVAGAAAACVAMGPASSHARAATLQNWPGWRGDGSGISDEKNLPTHWDANTNIAWKTPLPGEGNSSPIVWGDRVFVTASTEKGAKRHVICLSTKDGGILWNRELAADRESKTDAKNGYASPTPVTDGKRIYAFFNSPGLVALDMNGEVLWTRDLGPFENTWGMAASPALCDDMVILNCDHDGQSFVAAVNAADGEVRWKTSRNTPRQYATPLVITVGGKKQIVVNGGTVVAYGPKDGKEVWSCRGMKNMLSPSAVFAGGLVYVMSGRNGPSMAIDPSGRGDITETHVRMHFSVGGPYVPSPLVYPCLLLPGDNGMMRFINIEGKEVAARRVRDHFTSSPAAGNGMIYWTSENGNTYVMTPLVDAGTPGNGPASIALLATNSLGEKVLASPAIASGAIYIRTDKHLFRIVKRERMQTPAVVAAPQARSFEELKKLYDEHQAPNGDDIPLRLGIVEALGHVDDPGAIPLLKQIAQKDNHWDVSEEAVKVLGAHGEAALPAMIELLESGDWRPYLKIIPAGHAGNLKAAKAVPALLKLVRHNEPLVRIESLKALATIAPAHDTETEKVVTALVAALGDKEGVVRRAAIDGLASLTAKLGDLHGPVVDKLLDLLADPNPLVVKAARQALLKSFEVPNEVIMKDELLYGEQRKDPVVEHLTAGPISMKFQDGELRYLRAGGREIVRRIYFAVRDNRWDTVMPELKRIDVKKHEAGGFTINMQAVCKNDIADYRWSGKIEGAPDGKITFSASGQAASDFRSPRVGICVLYGAESLAGQKFEVINEKDEAAEGVFAEMVSQQHLAGNFRALRYTTADGMQFICTLDARVDMEDQRNFGDSSYKAFSAMPYGYPNVTKGRNLSQTLTLEVTNAKPTADAAPVTITVGEAIKGAAIPIILPVEQSAKGTGFMNYCRQPEKHADAKLITMPYNPAAHMPDDDTFMENIPAIVDQVKTIRAFAPNAKFRIDPIKIDSPYPRPGRDPRNEGRFASAWCARMIKYLAVAGVGEAVFNLGPGADNIRKIAGEVAGRNVLATDVGPHEAVDALAIDDGGRVVVWLINKTDQTQPVVVKKFSDGEKVDILRLDGSDPKQQPLDNGDLKINLAPFEVYLAAGRK
ncbi:MAG: PQQ-binding-like beta-propeller repeat protein [Planctomycetes bacterium]|nr:PQQ-binding-like beta-propeller repeat protein [Planctomycetota bacterium]